MITTIGNTKGGVGKSTFALNLALALQMRGSSVLAIDTNAKQRSIAKALSSRSADLFPVTCVELTDYATVLQQVPQLAARFDHVVIDVGGLDNKAFRAALMVSDRVLMPLAAETVELWAIDEMLEVLDEISALGRRPRLIGFINRAKSRGSSANEALAYLATKGVEVLPTSLVARDVWSSAFGFGQSVLEYKPTDKKAMAELNALIDHLESISK